MQLVVTTPASVPGALLDRAKDHLRVSGTNEDTLIAAYIAAAIGDAESYTGRAIFTTAYELRLDEFDDEILLPRSPLIAVQSVKYRDEAGSEQTFTSSNYRVVTSDDLQGRVWIKAEATIPTTEDDNPEAVAVAFTAGYGTTVESVPPLLLTGLLIWTGHLYDNRDGNTEQGLRLIENRFWKRFKSNWY
jgi:uncharacterized phiE125 gp8 family phage protein